MDQINGIILVNKPKGWTSQDVLSKLMNRKLKEEERYDKVCG